MGQPDPPPFEALSEALDEAIVLAREGRYAELGEHAAKIQPPTTALLDWKQGRHPDEPTPPSLEREGNRLKYKIFTLLEILRHAVLVRAALLQVQDAAQEGYSRDGHFPSSKLSHFEEQV